MTDLCHPLVGCPETSLHAYWSFIGNLDAHLQQTNGEIGVGLCCDPQPEVLMNIFCLDQILLHLWTQEVISRIVVNPICRDAMSMLFPLTATDNQRQQKTKCKTTG